MQATALNSAIIVNSLIDVKIILAVSQEELEEVIFIEIYFYLFTGYNMITVHG